MSAIQRAPSAFTNRHMHARDKRNCDQQAEQRKSVHLAHQIAQLAAPIRPSSITSA